MHNFQIKVEIQDTTCIDNLCLQNCLDGYRDFDLRVGHHQMGHYVLSLSNFDQNHCFARLKTNQKVFVISKRFGNFSSCRSFLQFFWKPKKSDLYRTTMIDNVTQLAIIPYLHQTQNLIEIYRKNTNCHLLFEFLPCETMKKRDKAIFQSHCL